MLFTLWRNANLVCLSKELCGVMSELTASDIVGTDLYVCPAWLLAVFFPLFVRLLVPSKSDRLLEHTETRSVILVFVGMSCMASPASFKPCWVPSI